MLYWNLAQVLSTTLNIEDIRDSIINIKMETADTCWNISNKKL